MRVPPDQPAPLDAWISARADPKSGRPEAIRLILADHLSDRPTATAEQAADDVPDEDRMAMWAAGDQGTAEFCRVLGKFDHWRRGRVLQALTTSNIDDVLHRNDWRRTVPYNVRRRAAADDLPSTKV